MADGGASTFIMLITGLLISSSVSAVLISEWSSMARAAQKDQQSITFANELGVEFAGDPMMVDLYTTGSQEITFYLQNTGEHPLDRNDIAVLVNGTAPATITTYIVNSGTWNSNDIIVVELQDTNFGTTPYVEGNDIKLFVIVGSETVSGLRSSASMNIEVRLS